MELTAYIFPGWSPRLRPASSRREWMDSSPESFAYRCLPLKIANGHGWEVLSPCGFEAEWNGGPLPTDVTLTLDDGAIPHEAPVALFGQATLTFHIAALFRTPPGWNLWIGGSPNAAKDGIAPLGGIIETDWSPYSFTMNWRFTRPHHKVRFEADEPIAFLMPVERDAIEGFTARIAPIDDDPALKAAFQKWSQSRDAFHAKMAADPPSAPADKWQKLYYRGVDPDGNAQIDDHRTKLRVAPFKEGQSAAPQPAKCPVAPKPEASRTETLALSKRNWVLGSLEKLRALSPQASSVLRYEGITADDFLTHHYAANRPALLANAAAHWPARSKWTPAYLRDKIGDREIEYQGNRTGNSAYEQDKDRHTASMPFNAFVDQITGNGAGNDAYITAYNSAKNAAAIAELHADLGFIDHILDRNVEQPHGMMWIGPEGTFTPLHHDLTNNLLIQLTGRKEIILVAPGETPKLYNEKHVFSQIQDIEKADLARFPLLNGVRVHKLELCAGDALFIPLGWWHQVTALDFSVTITHTNFRWLNDAYLEYPAE